jgi:mono/diheme cytochrome c family protein
MQYLTLRKTTFVFAVVVGAIVALSLAPPAGAADLANGKKVYADSCARCHGAGGKGDGAMAAYLDPKPSNFTDKALMGQRTDAQLKEVILQGKGAMPSYKDQMSEEVVDDVVAHLRSLAAE